MTFSSKLLAIDGGQTATKSLLAETDGTILATGVGGPSDHFHIEGGVEKNRIAIHGAIDSALDSAHVSAEVVTAIALGLTGAPTSGNQNPVVIEVVQERLPHLTENHIVIVPDYKTNLAGASGGKPGVVVIAGGGAIAYGYRDDGRDAIAGGFGYLIGDEGSAFDIGLRAIEAACKGYDQRGPNTLLQELVRSHFNVETIRQLPRVVYQAGFSRERIALLAPAVATAAENGDATAIEILDQAGRELATTALGVIRQIYSPGEPATVFLTGGVFKAGELVLGSFRSALLAGWPEAEAKKPLLPPAVGALLLAARAADIRVSSTWLETVQSTLVALE